MPDDVLERRFGKLEVNFLIVQRLRSKKFDNAAFQFADVFGYIGDNELDNRIVQVDSALFQLAEDDGFSRLIIRRLDICRKSPVET